MDKKTTTLDAEMLQKTLLRQKTHGLQMDKVEKYALINEVQNTIEFQERKGPGLKLSVKIMESGSPKLPPSSVFSGVGISPKTNRKSRKSLFRSKTKGEELNDKKASPKKDYKRVKSILKAGRTFGQSSDIQSMNSSKKSSMSRKVTFSKQTKDEKDKVKFRKSPYQVSRKKDGETPKTSMKKNLFLKMTTDIWK